MSLNIATLYKKRLISKDGQMYEILESKGPVLGYTERDFNDKKCFVITTGEYALEEAKILKKRQDDIDFYVVIGDIVQEVMDNNGIFDFDKIEKSSMFYLPKYFIVTSDGFFDAVSERTKIEEIDKCISKEIKKEPIKTEKKFVPGTISKMKKEITDVIISQDKQVETILESLYKNQVIADSNTSLDKKAKFKENILIYGPTGTGKTEILNRIKNLFDVPMVIEDCTSLSETGYVGRNISDMLINLYKAAGENIKKAERGILVIDEFDKLAEKDSHSPMVSRSGVQRGLLKLLDGADFMLNGTKINTSNLTIVALGAFSGIDKTVTEKTMGFGSKQKEDIIRTYSDISADDFKNYGLMPELVGRFAKYVSMNPLNKDDLAKILTESNSSPLNVFKEFANSIGVSLTYDYEFIEYIAKEAMKLNTGARGIKTTFENSTSGIMYKVFEGSCNDIHLVSPLKNENQAFILSKKPTPRKKNSEKTVQANR